MPRQAPSSAGRETSRFHVWKNRKYGKDSLKARLGYRISCWGDRKGSCLDMRPRGKFCSRVWFTRKEDLGLFQWHPCCWDDLKCHSEKSICWILIWLSTLTHRMREPTEHNKLVPWNSCLLRRWNFRAFQCISYLFSLGWDFPAWVHLSGVALYLGEGWGGIQQKPAKPGAGCTSRQQVLGRTHAYLPWKKAIQTCFPQI